jgi:methyl-accepting chemotaxis protein
MPLSSNSRADAFVVQSRLLEWVSPLPAFGGALAYLALIADRSASEWTALIACFGVYMVIAATTGTWAQRDELRSITDSLRAAQAEADAPHGSQSDQEASRRALISILGLPAQMRRSRFLTMLLMSLLVPMVMGLAGFEGWFFGAPLRDFLLVSLAAALLASTIQFYWARASFSSYCEDIAETCDLAPDAMPSTERSSLVWKLHFAIIMPSLVCLMLMLNFISVHEQRVAEQTALRWSVAALEAVAATDASLPLEARIALQRQAQQFWPLQIKILAVDANRMAEGAHAKLSVSALDVLDRALVSNPTQGAWRVDAAQELGAYRQIDGATMLIAVVDREELASWAQGAQIAIGLLCMGLVVFVLGVSSFVGRDLEQGLGALRAAAERLAEGDFRPIVLPDSGDEFGDLGRALEAAARKLNATMTGVFAALDQVEHTTADNMNSVAQLSSESADQLHRLLSANELMLWIGEQVREVAQSAEVLNESIDESSSSVAELGAAGTELNATASVLSAKVDEVSDSMEQMVGSVKQVASITEKLAAASEDTSSSMEEMASAMRVVDTSAETMANLSRDVVDKAEIGQAKVCQTIEGMEAIRQATDAAERVIRGLGARTQEIGGILDVIDDVADETNLLALNAAIIAAQAGEQGKAFSVVADEIKELADRVLASTKEIGGLIRSVQEESENAIGAIEAGSESVMSGVDLSAEAGRTLEEITDASRENGTRIGEIVSSVREQTKAAGHVVVLMERVRDSADEIAAASNQQNRSNEVIYRSALTMREVAQQVRNTTEEQSRGFGRISESVEGVRSAVEQIHGSLREQTGACGQVAVFLEEVSVGTRTSDEAAKRMASAMEELLAQAGDLRKEVERFRIS